MDKPNPDNAGEFFDQFLEDYYAECDEHLVLIRRALVILEHEVDAPAVDRSLLDNLFRSFHTLKGISGMVGLTAAEQLAHHLESYLRDLRQGTQRLSEAGFEALVAGVSLLENVINARRNDQLFRLSSKSKSVCKPFRQLLLRSRARLRPAPALNVGRSSLRRLRILPRAASTSTVCEHD